MRKETIDCWQQLNYALHESDAFLPVLCSNTYSSPLIGIDKWTLSRKSIFFSSKRERDNRTKLLLNTHTLKIYDATT